MSYSDPETQACEHEWRPVNDDFSHGFGTERVRYDECQRCGETRDVVPVQRDADCG